VNHNASGKFGSAKTVSASGLRAATSCAEFQRVSLGVAFGGLVEPAGIREIAEVADLQQAGERFAVFALPGQGQAKRWQNATV
jgi:hypothetical protein